MIDERADRHQLRELDDAAVVIGVEVRHEQIVDARQRRLARAAATMRCASRACRGSPGLESNVPAPAKPGVDEQRLAGGRDDERGLPALDVDEVDVESFRGAIAWLSAMARTTRTRFMGQRVSNLTHAVVVTPGS